MPEIVNQTVSPTTPTTRRRKVLHRGRLSQVSFIFGKLLRMFVYQNDWKVLPMAALIAALVSMVVKYSFFITREGTFTGAFALCCVGIWNGGFNSIQVICRERGIIKREHRSGMHISSYILSHMLYQALLCLAQTILTLYVCSMMGVQFPKAGFITPFFMLDMGITVFLITYASDMLSLFVSSLARTTTAAMTVMPFLLIFQLVFSGGIFSLPTWCKPVSNFTISKHGITCIAAQADYNNKPMMSAWNMVQNAKSKQISGVVTLGQALDFLSDDSNEIGRPLRAIKIGDSSSVGEVWEDLQKSESWKALLTKKVDVGPDFDPAAETNPVGKQNNTVITVGEALHQMKLDTLMEDLKDYSFGQKVTLGDVIDSIAGDPDIQKLRAQSVTVEFTVGQLIDIIGEARLRTMLTQDAAKGSRIPAYDRSVDNVLDCWFSLVCFILAFAVLSVLSLESIDRDRR